MLGARREPTPAPKRSLGHQGSTQEMKVWGCTFRVLSALDDFFRVTCMLKQCAIFCKEVLKQINKEQKKKKSAIAS